MTLAFRRRPGATWQVLVIDEVSMVDGGLLTKIDRLGRTIRGNELPFGGIQIVCSGDFCRGFRLATWQPT